MRGQREAEGQRKMRKVESGKCKEYKTLRASRFTLNALRYFAFLVLTSCFCLLFAQPKKEYDNSLLKLLEAGEFDKFTQTLSDSKYSAIDKTLQTAWFFLHTGEYYQGYLVLDPSYEDRFIYRYLRFMASISDKFITKESEHFKIRYFAEDALMADFALENLEKIYEKNGRLLGLEPKDKILVEIYPDKETFAVASTLGKEILEKSGTVGICKFNRIMILSPRNLPLGYRWLDTLSHEYCHFLINRITRFNCPLWVHEGVSRYSDTLWRLDESNYLSDYSAAKLKTAVENGNLIPFEKMSPSLVYLPTKDDISLAFAQVASFVDFFVKKFGKEKLKLWLANMKIYSEKEAIKKASSESFALLKKEWLKGLREAVPTPKFHGIPDAPAYNIKSEDEFLSVDSLQHIRLGDMLRQQGSNLSALLQYEKAYAQEKSPVVAVKIAKVKLALGNVDEARSLLEEVVKGNENYITPYLLLMEISRVSGDTKKAQFYAREAFSINPFYPGLYDLIKP